MAGAIISTVQALLKDVYLPPIIEQLNNTVLLLSRIENVTDAELVGNQVVVPLHKGRTGAIGSRAELGALPTSGNQVFARAVYDLTYHYGRIQVSGVAMAKTKSNAGAFADVLKLEMDGIKNDLRKDIARQVWGASDGNTAGNGRIATCGVTTATNVVVLNTDEALRKGHLYVGQRVDIGTAGSPTSLINGEAITAVSVTNKTITVTTSITTTTSNFVCRAGNAGNELNGLQSIVSTAVNTFGGIDASLAGNEYWDNLRDTAGGALSLDNLNKMWNRCVLADGDGPSILLTTYGIQRAYFNLLQAQVRYVQPLEIKSGYSSLEYMNKPLVADIDAKFGNIYFLEESHIKNYNNKDWDWLSEDGDVLKWVIGFDAWEAALAKYFQLGVDRRNVHGVMSGLTDATGF